MPNSKVTVRRLEAFLAHAPGRAHWSRRFDTSDVDAFFETWREGLPIRDDGAAYCIARLLLFAFEGHINHDEVEEKTEWYLLAPTFRMDLTRERELRKKTKTFPMRRRTGYTDSQETHGALMHAGLPLTLKEAVLNFLRLARPRVAAEVDPWTRITLEEIDESIAYWQAMVADAARSDATNAACVQQERALPIPYSQDMVMRLEGFLAHAAGRPDTLTKADMKDVCAFFATWWDGPSHRADEIAYYVACLLLFGFGGDIDHDELQEHIELYLFAPEAQERPGSLDPAGLSERQKMIRTRLMEHAAKSIPRTAKQRPAWHAALPSTLWEPILGFLRLARPRVAAEVGPWCGVTLAEIDESIAYWQAKATGEAGGRNALG